MRKPHCYLKTYCSHMDTRQAQTETIYSRIGTIYHHDRTGLLWVKMLQGSMPFDNNKKRIAS